jgi:hypothetical protein
MNWLTRVTQEIQLFLVPFLCVALLVRKDWIEGLMKWAPDDHDGLAELLLVFAPLALVLVVRVLTRGGRRVEVAR